MKMLLCRTDSRQPDVLYVLLDDEAATMLFRQRDYWSIGDVPTIGPCLVGLPDGDGDGSPLTKRGDTAMYRDYTYYLRYKSARAFEACGVERGGAREMTCIGGSIEGGTQVVFTRLAGLYLGEET